jgi:hypothetical protein
LYLLVAAEVVTNDLERDDLAVFVTAEVDRGETSSCDFPENDVTPKANGAVGAGHG